MKFAAGPARLRCAGTFFLLLFAACKDFSLKREQSLDVGTDTIVLSGGVVIHDVFARSEDRKDFHPASISAKPGDVIRFRADDARGHVIAFGPTLPSGARELFNRTGQLRSPPLLLKGATWIVSLEGAPAGAYPFRCEMHGIGGQLSIRQK